MAMTDWSDVIDGLQTKYTKNKRSHSISLRTIEKSGAITTKRRSETNDVAPRKTAICIVGGNSGAKDKIAAQTQGGSNRNRYSPSWSTPSQEEANGSRQPRPRQRTATIRQQQENFDEWDGLEMTLLKPTRVVRSRSATQFDAPQQKEREALGLTKLKWDQEFVDIGSTSKQDTLLGDTPLSAIGSQAQSRSSIVRPVDSDALVDNKLSFALDVGGLSRRASRLLGTDLVYEQMSPVSDNEIFEGSGLR